MAEQNQTAVDVRAGGASATLRLLEWDGAFFGARMGSLVDISHEADDADSFTGLVAAAVRAAEQQSVGHFIVRFDAAELAMVRACEVAGLRLVDAGIDLAMTPRATSAAATTAVRDARPDDLPWAQDFAALAFTHSRFWADPYFSADAARAFHREWVKNLWGGLAQRIFVAESAEGRPLGFNACSLSSGAGRIILIGSEGAARRSGVGRALVNAAIAWFADAGATQAFVKTQLGNVPALALYGRAGFTVHSTELTYSWSKRGQLS